MKAGQDAKNYFKKVNTTFIGLNKQEQFAKTFINLLDSGDIELYQKERRERRIFDDSWMKAVEEAIPVIDKLTRRPRENLKKTQMVVPVERAKKVDKDTVRHLASNTQFIKEFDRDGNVIPTKVLTSFSESDLGTYENRFLRTLVDNLFMFIEKRYDLIMKKMHTEYVNHLNIKSKVTWFEAVLDYDITFQIHRNMTEDEIDKRNQNLLNRIIEIRTAITNFKLSKFMMDMKEFAPITPPILQTNIIMKNVDFKRCYDLWILVEQADKIGFDVDTFERDVEFEEAYLSQIENALMFLYATVAYNQTEDFVLDITHPFEYRKTKRPKINKTNPSDLYIQPGYYQMENYQLSQYVLDQVRKSNVGRFKTLTEAGIPVKESLDIIFKQVNDIATSVYEDYIKNNFHPEEKKTLEEKAKVEQEIIDIYKQLEQIKKDDLRTLQTARAISLLNLRNTKDAIKRKNDEEKLLLEQEKEQERLAKEAEKQQREQERLEKKRKIEQAKKILEEAKLERNRRALEDNGAKPKKKSS